MQTRNPNTRTVPPIESREQWHALARSVATEGDVIVEVETGEKVAVISYDEFLEFQEQRKMRLREEANVRLQEAMKEQEKLTQDLSEEEVERIALEVGREVRESLNAKYRVGLIGFPERDPE